MNKVYLGNNYIADKSPLTSSDVANITSALLGLDASTKVFDASIKALDASALAFDSSIKELAQGGGGSDPVFIKVTNSTDSTKEGFVNRYANYDLYSVGKGSIILNGPNPYNYPAAPG